MRAKRKFVTAIKRSVLTLLFNYGASHINSAKHLSTRQYARIVKALDTEIGLGASVNGTHTMRRTNASQIYRRTKNLRAVQLLLGHTKLESTTRYLGNEVDDTREMAEQTEVR